MELENELIVGTPHLGLVLLDHVLHVRVSLPFDEEDFLHIRVLFENEILLDLLLQRPDSVFFPRSQIRGHILGIRLVLVLETQIKSLFVHYSLELSPRESRAIVLTEYMT